MSWLVASRRRSRRSLEAAYPGASMVDVTSRAEEPWVRLSPFFPHGGIPVPFTPEMSSASVEGAWQALKVFDSTDVDPAALKITTMSGIKRTVRRNGPVLGHRAGMYGSDILDYRTARQLIFLPTYLWVLQHRAADLVEQLREAGKHADVVLLDYTTNGDVNDLTTPLSHAALLRHHLAGTWPG
jgi:hypothetical protein